MAVPGESRVPSLPRSVKLVEDKTRQRWILNAPERIIVLDETASEVLRLCDGARTIATICDLLAARYDAPRPTIAADVAELLDELANKRLLEMSSA